MRTTPAWLRTILAAILLLLLPAVISFGHGVAQTRVRDRATPVDPQVELARTRGLPVEVGAFIENLHDLSLRERTFIAEGYYWLQWPVAVQQAMDEAKMEPLELVELTNQVSGWDALIQPETAAPVRLPDGGYYQLFRFSANFYIPHVDLRRSPFERIALPIILEVRPDLFARQNKNIVLLPSHEKGNSSIGAYASINGYDVDSVRLVSLSHSYGTNWGRDQGDLYYSQLALEVVMKGDIFSSFVTWVLPLLIVMSIVLLAPSLGGELGDIRLAIPSTALLTLIFLQQSYKSELPLLNYLTFLDTLYAYSYLVSLVLFVLFVWGTNVYAKNDDKPASLLVINRVDRIFQIAALSGFCLVVIIAWVL